MFDKEAITAIQHAAAINDAGASVHLALAHHGILSLPNHFTERDLEPYMPNRRRARGTMATNVVDDFATYTKAHLEEGAAVFVNAKDMAATAVLNLGTPTKPGHADSAAKLTAQKTAAMEALGQHAWDKALSQQTAAEFLEDWKDIIHCYNDAGAISTPQAIAALRKLTIEAMRKVESSQQNLSASQSAFESVAATSASPIPTTIHFSCVPYKDLAERTFVLRLGVQTGDKAPTIKLRIVKAELHQEEMATELATKVREALGGTLPVLVGSYSKA